MSESLPLYEGPVMELLGVKAEDFPGLERLAFADGEYIIREGQRADEFYILEEGAMVVERSGDQAKDDPPVTLHAIISDPESLVFFGEMAHFLDGVRTASIRATGRTVVLQIRSGSIRHLFFKAPGVAQQVCRRLVCLLRDTTDNLVSVQQRFRTEPEQIFVEEGNSVLFRAGDPADTLYQIMVGSARLTAPDGSTRSVDVDEGPESFLNAAPFFAGGPNSEQCESMPGSIVLAYDASKRAEVIGSFPELVLSLLRS